MWPIPHQEAHPDSQERGCFDCFVLDEGNICGVGAVQEGLLWWAVLGSQLGSSQGAVSSFRMFQTWAWSVSRTDATITLLIYRTKNKITYDSSDI